MITHYKMQGTTKFSAEDVLRLKEIGRLPPGHPDRDARLLADLYGCGPETIRRLWRGETFRKTGAAMNYQPPPLEPEKMEADIARLMEVQKKREALEAAGLIGPTGKPSDELMALSYEEIAARAKTQE